MDQKHNNKIAHLEIEKIATDVFGDSQKAKQWMHLYNLALDESPANYLNSGKDKQNLLRILNAIAYGGLV